MFTFFDGTSGMFYGLDNNYAIVDSFYCIGKETDFHDIHVLPNGEAYLIAEYFREVDMSQIVQGGKKNARVRYFTIQHIGKNKNLIWEWDTYDHFDIMDATYDVNLTANTVNFIHMNSLWVDDDGNILICSRHLDEVTKINRQTGEIIWRMGGKYCKNNEFAFINDTIDGFWGFSHQHDIQRLPNGNILLLDNGNLKSNQYSRAVEYEIDEANLTAMKVWEYRKDPDVFVPWMGNVQRLTNGNTLIGWGAAKSVEHDDTEVDTTLTVTEVRPDGTITYEMSLINTMSYRVYRYPLIMNYVTKDINGTGTYDFVDSKNRTNIKLNINQINRNEQIRVEKHNYEPRYLDFYNSTPCVVYPYRWVISSSEISSIKGVLKIDLSNLGNIDLLGDLHIYKRNNEVFGEFTKLATTYNSTTKELSANFEGLGEFIIASERLQAPKIPKPAHLTGGVNVSSRLFWNSVYGATKYQVQLTNDSTFQNLLYDIDINNDTSMIFYELDYFENYYWRVRSYNQKCISAWSNKWSFSTTLNAPILNSPNNDERNVYPKSSFKWSNVVGATAYRIQIDIDSTFKQPIKDIDNISSNFYEISGLDYNEIYYWRVLAKRSNAISAWSNIKFFRTIIATPVLNYPSDGAVGISIDGLLEWKAVDGAEYYRIQIADNSEFLNPIIEAGGILTNKFEYSDLEHEKIYYWRVQAINFYSRGDFSDASHLRTIHSPPKLSKPSNNSINTPTTINFSWVSRPIYNFYRLQIAVDSNFSEIVIDIDSIGNDHILLTNLAENHTYYWRVNATNSEGKSQWSEIWEFTTRASEILELPTIANPKNEQHGVPLTGYLAWHTVKNATKYRVQISLDADFTNLISDFKEISILSVLYSRLNYYTDYYWRVSARNNFASSDWSETYSFRTKIQEPMLKSPGIDELDVPRTGFLMWDGTKGSNKYHLQLSDDYSFNFNILDVTEITDTQFEYKDLLWETKYYWRVRGYDERSFSDWSNIWSFTTEIATNITETNHFVHQFEIFPNPSKGSVQLRINGDIKGDINIEMRSILGKSLMKLGNINALDNPKIITFDFSSFANGVYYIIIYAQKTIITKELILIQ